MLKIISVSGSQLQITKLWVNLKSTILKCMAVIPRAIIGKPSAVFSLAVVAVGGLVTVFNVLVSRVSE